MATESFVLGTFCFAAYFGLLAVVLRVSHRSPAALSIMLAIAIYPFALASSSIATAQPLMFWPFSAAYWFATITFLMVFGAVYKSISLRILLELLETKYGRDSYDSLLERYVAGASFHDRLGVMIAAGLADRHADGYVLTRRGRIIARSVSAMQRAFGITRSG